MSTIGQEQTFQIVTKSEFAILILWVILPPLLVGGTLMWRLQSGVRPQIAFVLLSLALTVALLLFGPNWLGRYLGLHDVEFMGRQMMWSPLGWVCAIAAWPVAALLSRRKKTYALMGCPTLLVLGSAGRIRPKEDFRRCFLIPHFT